MRDATRNSEVAHAPGPDGRPAGLARRALVRHLLAAAARARRVRRHARSTTTIANLVVAQLLHLEAEDPEKDIQLYVNSPGGVVYAGLAIYDTMRFIKPDVATTCCGIAMSMGSLILAGGAHGQALGAAELPHPHPPAARRLPGPGDRHPDPRQGGARAARGGWRRSTPSTPGKPIEEISDALERDRFFTPEEARGLRADRPRHALRNGNGNGNGYVASSSSSSSVERLARQLVAARRRRARSRGSPRGRRRARAA